MPNRILNANLVNSEKIDKISNIAFRTYINLILCVDDYGRFDGRTSVLLSSCFPLKREYTVQEMASWIQELEENGLVQVYYDDKNKPYIRVTNWEKHQKIRAQKSKFPEPPEQEQLTEEEFVSDSVKKKDKKEKIHRSEDFERWYNSYIKKVNKDDACKAYNKRIQEGFTPEVLFTANENYSKHPETLKKDIQYIPYPATFLNKGYFKDWIQAQQSETKQLTFEEQMEILKNQRK